MNPFLLLILDGWGHREEAEHNAIAAAQTPTWDKWCAERPYTTLQAHGSAVGLPDEQMGNSEVGHLNIGAGRIVWQDFTRINQCIEDGKLSEQHNFSEFVRTAIADKKPIHILGLLSDGGVHSHLDHIIGLITSAHKLGASEIYVHAFLDGRDTAPKSAQQYLAQVEACLHGIGCGHVASIMGRYWAMDRDRRWDRTEQAYRLLTEGRGEFEALSPVAALEQAYARGETDEFVSPTVISTPDSPPVRIFPKDAIIFANFRSDRTRQLTRAFIDPDFDSFNRRKQMNCPFLTMTRYDATFNVPVIFPPDVIENSLGQVISENQLKQKRIAETEKYAHVTFFLNGGIEPPFPLEERALIPSPKVATYDLKPEMSAQAVCDEIVKAITNREADVVIANFANADMVGHTGNFDATVKAIETLDSCFAQIETALESVDGQALITADHGNAEHMFDPETDQSHTAHTCEPVPLVYLGSKALQLESGGTLPDVAPTMLKLLEIECPEQMTGKPLA
ncbi:MAG: phosphoglycerate mutase (2,3-diphosphoglycerate-independent) [Legionellales bacterium]|nr:phosphoglycerate mutase (2,3-diphosphoglycerate-independent) [Legionellales bacterium]